MVQRLRTLLAMHYNNRLVLTMAITENRYEKKKKNCSTTSCLIAKTFFIFRWIYQLEIEDSKRSKNYLNGCCY